MVLFTRLIVEVPRVADMDVAVSAMNGRIWLDIKSLAEISINVVGVVLCLKDIYQL